MDRWMPVCGNSRVISRQPGIKGVAGEEGPESPKYRASGTARSVWRAGSCRKMGSVVKFMRKCIASENSFPASLAKDNPRDR